MAAPYILAKTLLDAHTFAREELGLGKGHYRVVTSPSSISGRRGTDLYLVPGYEARHDRFAMAGALKYTRLNKIDATEPRQNGVPDDIEPAGEQLTLIDADEATDFLLSLPDPAEEQARIDRLGLAERAEGPHGNATTMSFEEALTIAQQDEAPAKRIRRRRCEECGELVLPDEFEQHTAEHLPEGE